MQVKMHIFYMPDCHIAGKNAYTYKTTLRVIRRLLGGGQSRSRMVQSRLPNRVSLGSGMSGVLGTAMPSSC